MIERMFRPQQSRVGCAQRNPVLVVRADANVIDGHGDIANEQLHALLRQLYLDSLSFRAAPL